MRAAFRVLSWPVRTIPPAKSLTCGRAEHGPGSLTLGDVDAQVVNSDFGSDG